MSGGLTDAERLVVLSPCACGHDINDHGELVGCWSCPEQGDECSVSFESMLAERVARIKAQAVAAARADEREQVEATVESVLDAAQDLVSHFSHEHLFWQDEIKRRTDTYGHVHRDLYRYYSQDRGTPAARLRDALAALKAADQ